MIAVIGAGAGGLMCVSALIANGYQHKILLFDKNKNIGEKVLITGGGRCNVTNNKSDIKKLLSKYIRGEKFLSSSMRKFPPHKVMEFFEKNGVKLKTEDDDKIFPVSNKSSDIISVFAKIISENKNIELHLGETVCSIIPTEAESAPSQLRRTQSKEVFQIKTSKPTCTVGRKNFFVDRLVIATGGQLVFEKSTYQRIQNLGHNIIPLKPSLSSFITKQNRVKQLQGLSFNNVRILFEIKKDGKVIQKKINGPLLFTHFGISGPVAFELSAHIAYSKFSQSNPFSIKIQIDESKDFQFWNNELIRHQKENKNKKLKTILGYYFPSRFVDTFLYNICPPRECGNPVRLGSLYNRNNNDIQINALTKEDRKTICNLLSIGFDLDIIGTRPGDEFVVAGGIDTAEINPKTMESKIVPGLYFAGEVMNIDGITGGYNLQAAWCTGSAAANNIC